MAKHKKKCRITRSHRKYIYGVALATLPIITALGIITEEMAVLYATLLGTILVPWMALNDQSKHEIEQENNYIRGLDEGWQAANSETDRLDH